MRLLRRPISIICLSTAAFASLVGCAKSDGQTQTQTQVSQASPSDHTWTLVTEHAAYPTGYNYPVFVAKGRMWAMHAEGNWESTDAKTWTKSELPAIRGNVYKTQYVQFKDSIYALGDNSGDFTRMNFSPRVRRTTDFRKWEDLARVTNLPSRIFAGVTVFKDKMLLIGGYDGQRFYNDVWSSTDGIQWTQVTGNAGWTPRTVSTVVVFKDKIYLIGGGVIDGMTNPNPTSEREIWTSTDGSTWSRVETDLQNRAGGFPIVYDDKLWLVGANRDGSFARSSLVSTDGARWNEVAAPWSPRGGAAAWIFNDKLYMTGGKYSVTENGQIRFIYSNDVWVMSKNKEKSNAGS
jgi:hypothetical protein